MTGAIFPYFPWLKLHKVNILSNLVKCSFIYLQRNNFRVKYAVKRPDLL